MNLFKSLIITSALYCYVVVGIPINDAIQERDIDDIVGKTNLNDSNKDLYVVHAVVYQAGIITNKSEDELNRTGVLGNQEAVTFYHTNGSELDLSGLPSPLVTNVTAQRVVGVAPVDLSAGAPLPWTPLEQFTTHRAETAVEPRQPRDVTLDYDYGHSEMGTDNPDYGEQNSEQLYKRSLVAKDEKKTAQDQSLEKGSLHEPKTEEGKAPVKTLAGLPSIVIPPLEFQWINTSISELPAPIINTTKKSSVLY